MSVINSKVANIGDLKLEHFKKLTSLRAILFGLDNCWERKIWATHMISCHPESPLVLFTVIVRKKKCSSL